MFVATVVQAATSGPTPTSKYHHHRQQKVSTSSSEVIQRDGWIPASHYYGSLTYLDQLREDGGSGLSGSVTMTSSGSLPSRGGFRDTLVMSSSSRGTVPAVVEPAKESKKWTFGGLFKRKSKTSSAASSTTVTPIPASALPAHLTRSSVKSAPNPVPKPARALPPPVALSSELSSSDDETLAVTRAQQHQQQQQPKQNFISRQLSKRKEKKGQSGSSSKNNGNGLLKVPPPLQNGRRVGSSPDVVTTGTAPWSPWNGWEDTRRQNNSQNCSSSSMEGSLKNTRMAAREAVKARAVARRESFLCSSSSENDENDNSAQGSHSSLSSRRRLKRMSRPELVRSMSPGRDKLDGYLPPSPRWEARIVYTSQETTEQVEPVVLRLPTSAQPRRYALEDEEDEIISAGLEVPLVVPTASPYPPDDRTYANLPNPGLMYSAAPPPPPRDFKNHFYRPVSCSYLDNYVPHDSMMMMDSGYDNVGLPFMRTPAHRAPSEPKVIAKPIPRPAPQQQPVLSKMGYPVRRLADAHKLPATQSPVHMRASEFWRKKELEQGPISPNPRSFMTRIRSAGNSPVPGGKLTTATRASPKLRPTISPISNDSISSLSSLSAEALAKPRNTSSPITRSPLTATQRTIARPTTLNLINSAPKTGLSACERLKVKLPSARASPAPEESTVAAIKTSGKNLEDALNELEDMYKSLRLSDEDLLDRAERRDLPTVHQQLRSRSPLGSMDNLDTASIISTPSSARGSCFGSQNALQQRNRAPPLRRSGRPDTVNDDMAKRRFDSPEVKPNDPRSIVGKSGSYMVFSPAFSPPSTPPPFDPLAYDDPDLQADDVSYRNYKRANAIRIIEAPPPFGIPLAPGAPAPDSDYLHAQPKENFRPLFRHSKRPDLVKDDIAFRNLRKDLGGQEPLNRTDWTPKLFPNKSDAQPGDLKRSSSKKLRAVRSLSANISHLIPFKDSRVSAEIGKWNSYSDLTPFKSALNYMEPSWVDQVEAVATKETLAANERVIRKMKSPVPLQLDRRPWTDVLLESFEKEKAEIERLNQEAEDALSQLDKREAGDGQEDAQVYQESSTDEFKSKDFQESNPSDDVIDSTQSDSPKIQGLETDPVTPQQPEPPVPKKRTTLSISPQHSDEAAESNKPTTLFTPPRKVHQIQLDSFHVVQEEKAAAAAAAEELKKSSKDSELNELIDALVRDADTCGPSKDETSPAATSSNCSKSEDCKNSQGGGSSKEKFVTKSKIQVAGFLAHISDEGRESNEGQSEPQSPKVATSSSDEVGKDKSSKRKSYLNRSLTDEPLPLFNGVEDEKQRRRSRCSSRPLSQDVTSLLATAPITKGCSSSEDTRAVIVKAPQIPAIFQNSVDNKLMKEPPSSTRRASAITAKIKVFEAEDSKELKPQQAEGGMSSIKRLLQKESKQQQQPLGERKAETLRRFETPIPTSSTEGPTFFTVKRSPSAGSNFNMSKVTNSQPSFLRKFFEKPSVEQQQQQQKKMKEEEDEQKIQKDQNEKDYEEEKTKEKSKTEEDPVLGLSVVEKATLFMKLEHEQRFSKWRKGTPTELPSGFQSPVDKVIDQPSVNKSSFPSHDRYPSTAPTPINLRDRRSVFEPSRPPSCRGPCESSSYPRQTPIRTPFDPADRRSVMEEFSTPIGWLPPDPSYFFSYPSNVYSPSVHMARRRGSISDADLNCAMRQMGQGYHGFPPPPPPYPFNCIPPHHHHPPPPPPFFHPKQPQPPQVRGYRVRSLFVSGTSDHETHSEDGEVSSGGQEVAEIISKSYENSPVFRKKSWRSQKKVQQKVMTKEVWRRCSQQQQHQDDTDVNDVFYDARSEFEDFDKEKQHLPPPSTSNLLPILTALSSSNDELDDGNTAKTNKPKISRKTLSSSVSSQKTEVTVPQADDESFRAFFQHPRFPPLCPPPPQASKGKTLPADHDPSNNNNDFSSVKREADMLVMKKHVPLVRRKSSGKSKNPLKVLAARFDFTNQKYTEVHTSQQ